MTQLLTPKNSAARRPNSKKGRRREGFQRGLSPRAAQTSCEEGGDGCPREIGRRSGAKRAVRKGKRREGAEDDGRARADSWPPEARRQKDDGVAPKAAQRPIPSVRVRPELPCSEERGGRSRGLQRQGCPPSSLRPKRGARGTFFSFGGGAGDASSFPYNFPFPKTPDFSWEKLPDKIIQVAIKIPKVLTNTESLKFMIFGSIPIRLENRGGNSLAV